MTVIPEVLRHNCGPLRWAIALFITGTAAGASFSETDHGGLWSIVSTIAVIVSVSLVAVLAVLIYWSCARLHSAEQALNRSEEKFRSLVTNAPYGICSCTADGVLLDANPAMTAMLGYPASSGLSQRRLSDLYRDPEQFSSLLDESGWLKQFDAVRAEWKRWDNTPIVVRLSGRPIRDERQQVFFEIVAEDVSERHALEQQFRQAQKMEAVGRLAGGVAHDFNNLLMVISGYCELLLAQLGADPELRRPAEEILKATDRAAALTRQLLAFSRKQVQTPRVLDLNAVVAEHLKMLPRLIGEDIKLIFSPGAPSGQVRVDPGQIQQVIMNLAVNARDAMPNGGKLIIETANVFLDEQYSRKHHNVPSGEYVLLTITDTGSGMDADTQSHLFEPFFTTKGQKGTGLGLSTVYGIVKQSGGHIWAESAAGEGTTFNIYLPHIAQLEQAAPQELAEHRPQQGRETVLIVEDEPALRSLARVFLEARGYTVLEADNGEAALDVARMHRGPIHLLLTDVIMPGMNGRQLAEQFTSDQPGIRVLYMSGYIENAIGRNGTLDPQINLLEKPFTSATLACKVRAVLDAPPAAQPIAPPPGVRPEIARAPRFTMQLPLRFRITGETEWVSATTENISRSGVLFRTDRPVSPSEQIELQLTLPAEITGHSTVEVACQGEVVRTIDAAAALPPGLAARILKYQFLRGAPVAQA
jgi:PAS domain S-box-containing protein